MFSRIVENFLSFVDVGIIGRTTLKLSCTFMLNSLSLCSRIDILMHQSFCSYNTWYKSKVLNLPKKRQIFEGFSEEQRRAVGVFF